MAKVMCCKSLVLPAAGAWLSAATLSVPLITVARKLAQHSHQGDLTCRVIRGIWGGVLLIQGISHLKPRHSFAREGRGLWAKPQLGQGGGFESQRQTERWVPCPPLTVRPCAASSSGGPMEGAVRTPVKGVGRQRLACTVGGQPGSVPCEPPLFPPFRLSWGSPTHVRPLCRDHKVTGIPWALGPAQAGLVTSPPRPWQSGHLAWPLDYGF